MRQSKSGSVYYKIGTSIVRCSDHLGPMNINELQVVETKNDATPIVVCCGNVLSFANYSKVLDFVKNFILISECCKLKSANIKEDNTVYTLIGQYRSCDPVAQKKIRQYIGELTQK